MIGSSPPVNMMKKTLTVMKGRRRTEARIAESPRVNWKKSGM